MSELTSCNFCTLQGVKRRAKRDGMRVITMPGTPSHGLPAGVEVYVVPKGVKKEHLTERRDLRERFGGRWFMVLTGHCCC
jgi:hypothetical protein